MFTFVCLFIYIIMKKLPAKYIKYSYIPLIVIVVNWCYILGKWTAEYDEQHSEKELVQSK